MSFAKLDHGIVNSSIWSESLATRVLWITMLALKDENGFVGSSRSGLARIANISPDDFDSAILCLESPDKDSRTSDYEGRRVEKIEGGWVILNSDKYRLPEDKRKEYMREYMQKRRSVNLTKVNSKFNACLPSVSVSVSESVSGIKDNRGMGEEGNKPKSIYTEQFEQFWKEYPRKVGKGKAFKNWQVALKTTEPDLIINGAKKYAEICKAKGTEEAYIKHPEGWLTARRWEDEGVSITEKQSYISSILKEGNDG